MIRTGVPISKIPAVAPPVKISPELASPSGTAISGRITPARICVAPFTLAIFPTCASNNWNVRFAIAMSPKPSVTSNVIPIFSLPVTATPKSYPSTSRRSASSIPPQINAATPTSRARRMPPAVMRAPPTTIAPFIDASMCSSSRSSVCDLPATISGPHVSPPTPKIPCTKSASVSTTTPSLAITSIIFPAT